MGPGVAITTLEGDQRVARFRISTASRISSGAMSATKRSCTSAKEGALLH